MNATHIHIFKAIRALDPNVCIKLAITDKWYICSTISIVENGTIASIASHADTPEISIDAAWYKLRKAKRIRTSRLEYDVRWNGFMWDKWNSVFAP